MRWPHPDDRTSLEEDRSLTDLVAWPPPAPTQPTTRGYTHSCVHAHFRAVPKSKSESRTWSSNKLGPEA
jgi:hypothetical protein